MEKNKMLQSGVLITGFTQFISPVLTSFKGDANESNVQFTPAGYTFSIWGVITLLAFAYGIYQSLPKKENKELHIKIAPRLIIIYILFSIWLFTAQNNWLLVTVIVFILMFWQLGKVFESILANKNHLTKTEIIILEGQIGLYFGWSSIAIFANTGATLKFYGVSDLGTFGLIWQSLLLTGGLINTIFILSKTKGNYFYGGTIIWAFMGIFFGLRNEPNTIILQIVAITALCIFSFAFYKLNKSGINALNYK